MALLHGRKVKREREKKSLVVIFVKNGGKITVSIAFLTFLFKHSNKYGCGPECAALRGSREFVITLNVVLVVLFFVMLTVIYTALEDSIHVWYTHSVVRGDILST